ncbi:hypothetical protein [Eggerthella sinensis]|uniref:Uncharacterized protein n=1 Tax=Eggerthella sinensis TaxID=242230 RepID=A0A3N0ITH7_9ACTN|nr:hypothetical protein [Eggerthella sinensis]RDB63656.1 hypothetical protein C1876_16795 [Eggerthella sinensis]RNM40275.1 hypothetical protein DMP09_15080 [Eggerthella sinensis]
MDKDIQDFIDELGNGEYGEARCKLINQYRENAKLAKTHEAAALVGIEFADRLTFLTLAKYAEWIRQNRADG